MPTSSQNTSHSGIIHTRRSFIKYTALSLGAAAISTPSLVRGAMSRGNSNHAVRGRVCSGRGISAIPIPGAIVSLYQATGGGPLLLGTTLSKDSGDFSIHSQVIGWGTGGIFYVTADSANGLQLVAILGPTLLPFVTINELTTVAAGYAFAQFATEGVLSGDEFGLQIAAGMNDNLVEPATGASSSVITLPPNADQTNSWRSTHALANLLALFVQHNGAAIDQFYALATPPGGNAPTNLLQALSNIARYPQQNVPELFALATQVSVYLPTLVGEPDAWTIVVKVNYTGDDNYLFGGPGNIAFDADGYAWISNNVVQGTNGSGRFAVVLKPDGRPADGLQGKPKSPLLGGGLLGGGYGVSIAPNGHVWFGNFGWGGPQYWPSPDGNGSLSEFTKNGHPISGPLGYQGGPFRAQAVVPDASGNLWIASFENDRVYVFLKGNPNHAIYYQQPFQSGPFGIQIASDGTAWVSNSGGLRPQGPGSIARYALGNGQLQQIFLLPLGNSNKGIVLDSQGYAWMASGGDDYVYRVKDDGTMYWPYVDKSKLLDRGGMNAPWGITIDGDDNIWVGNFGPEKALSDFTNTNITKLAGPNPATRPPGLSTGDPISPRTGYTLPSGGDQVRLHNGEPLYGPGGPACYTPLMRITALAIDRAGNVWATNNWKPNFDIDVSTNSGGDGICIFVGMAKPPPV